MRVEDFLEICDVICDVNTSVMIKAMKAVPLIFTKLCNNSVITGKFPTCCKTAKITIIPKKGDTCILDNLRPISILSLIGKILEKYVKKIIVQFFEENELFYNLFIIFL